MDKLSTKRRSDLMSRVRSKNTKPELLVRRLVHGMGFRYRLHIRSLAGTPDMVFRKLKKAIFVHGCFWHGHSCPRGSVPSTNTDFWTQKIAANRNRDRRSEMKLHAEGWSVLIVWECELNNVDLVKGSLIRFLAGFASEKK